MGNFDGIPGVIEKRAPQGARPRGEYDVAIGTTHSVQLGGMHQVSSGVEANGVETPTLPTNGNGKQL